MSEPKLSWENIESVDNSGRLVTKRTRIPGGWLVWVAHAAPLTGAPLVGGPTFVPDPGHKWDGNSLQFADPALRHQGNQDSNFIL